MAERNTKENLGGNKIKEFQIGKVGIFLILIQTENGFTNIPKLNIIQNIIRSWTQIVAQLSPFYNN